MVKKSNLLWFDTKILILLIAFHIQNVTSFWGKENFIEEKSKEILSEKKVHQHIEKSPTCGSLKLSNCIIKA